MKWFLFLMALLIPVVAQAADQPSEPLKISAQKALEWHRNDRQYVAMGDVIATQGATTIKADKLIADYTDGGVSGKKGNAITKLTAVGNVVISSGVGNQAFGDHAVYDLATKQAVMTGQNLKLVTPEQTITATDKFEYWTDEGRLTATGNAVVVQADDTLRANVVSAWFNDAPDGPDKGSRVMTRAEAVGGVIITTPTETVTGSSGVFERFSQLATLQGPVKIVRGPNVLNGVSASIDLATNISTLYGDKKSGGRVTGVFFPDAKKKDAKPASANFGP
jgi:lipopolysaccharide export system protein LptA